MAVSDIAGSYVKYIGAGMMLCGGIIGAVKLIPTITAKIIKDTIMIIVNMSLFLSTLF